MNEKTFLEWNKIYNGDCFELLESIDNIDLILTSPPFLDKEVPEEYYSWLQGFLGIALKVSPRILMFNSSNRLIQICKRFEPSQVLIWDLKRGMTAFRYQPIFLFLRDKTEKVWGPGRIYSNCIAYVQATNKIHINQDSVKVYERLLQYFPNAKNVVDPFMGSGTTAVACINQKRNFIGIEKDKECYEISLKRLSTIDIERKSIYDYF